MQIRDRVKELRRVPASELRPSPRNWRTHPARQRDALRGILAEVGYADALLAREVDGGLELIDGHLRAETTPDAVVPVLVLDVTEDEAGKLLATLDPLAAMAEADAGKLDALLRDVQTGSEALAGMLTDLAAEHGVVPQVNGQGGDDFDPTPEDSGPTRTSPGELWQIGGAHRLLVGDCTVRENVERLMGGETPFLMVTDPPYGVEYDATWRVDSVRTGELRGTPLRGVQPVTNDAEADWSVAVGLFTGDVVYCWHACWHASITQQCLLNAGFQIRSQLIWRKPNFVISRGHYHFQHEPCWYAVRNGTAARWAGARDQATVWDIPSLQPMGRSQDGADIPTGHSTQKPLECMARPIRNHGAEGDLVYDPFLGSGTTLIAAHRLGRRCYGCEIEPRYADVILKRAEAEGLECCKL